MLFHVKLVNYYDFMQSFGNFANNSFPDDFHDVIRNVEHGCFGSPPGQNAFKIMVVSRRHKNIRIVTIDIGISATKNYRVRFTIKARNLD